MQGSLGRSWATALVLDSALNACNTSSVGSQNYAKMKTQKSNQFIHKVSLIAFMVFATSCATVSSQAKSANITYVTHPRMVEGRTFKAGYSMMESPIYDISYVGVKAVNSAAKDGWSNCVILVELISPGQIGNQFAPGRAHQYMISIYR